MIGSADLGDTAIGFLCVDRELLLACLMQVLRGAKGITPATRTAAGLDALGEHCRRAAPREARPPTSLRRRLVRFLADPERRDLDWPLRRDGPRHVHGMIDVAELPVHHQTRRTGRPYTLVLTKTLDVFDRESQARHRDEADLVWLSEHRGVDVGQARR